MQDPADDLPEAFEDATLFPGGRAQRLWFFWVTAALPSICFALSLGGLQLVEWKDPSLDTWPALLVDRPGALGFLPLAIPVIVLCSAIAVRPGIWVAAFPARLALGIGTLLALQYSLLNIAVLALSHESRLLAGVIQVVVWFFLALAGAEFASLAWRDLSDRFGASRVWATFALASWSLGAVWLRQGNPGESWAEAAIHSPLVFFFAWVFLFLVAGPVWSLLALVKLQGRLESQWPRTRKTRLLAFLGFGAYLASWRLALFQATRAYEKLPDQPPDCFVATAAARAPCWLTGGVAVRSTSGGAFHVTPQLQRLKLCELALCAASPRLHHLCRGIYDRVGPKLARQVRSPWRAALAWIVLEAPARLLVTLVLGAAGRAVERRWRGIYLRSADAPVRVRGARPVAIRSVSRSPAAGRDRLRSGHARRRSSSWSW